MTQILTPPSSNAIRDELQALVLGDLLGPAGGLDEELDEKSVSERYLVGILAPQNKVIGNEAFEDLALGGAETDEDGKTDVGAPQAKTLIPSSIGLSFTMSGGTSAIKITAGWGRYLRQDSATIVNHKTGNPQKVWKRTQIRKTSEPIKLKSGSIKPWVVNEEQPQVTVRGLMRRKAEDWIITLFLVNGQQEPKRLADEAWIFQPELMVEAADGSAAFIKRHRQHDPGKLDAVTHAEERAMAMLYRHQVEFAVGHGVAVHADTAPSDPSRAVRVLIQAAPVFEVSKQTPPTEEELPLLKALVLDMKVLAETKAEDLPGKLLALPLAYAHWIENERKRLNDPDLSEFLIEAESALKNCERVLGRIHEGLETLKNNPQAVEAFRFANRSMWLQRIHTIMAEKARRGEKVENDQIDRPENRSWYPFQLAFIILNLPGVTDLQHKDRTDETEAVADLLWFPTGGGKTEAYLGLAAYTMGLRRLQGEIAGRSGEYGVAVIMRYTLRRNHSDPSPILDARC